MYYTTVSTPGISKTTTMFEFTKHLYNNLNFNQRLIGLFMDSKSFDIIDYKILLQKVDKYGLRVHFNNRIKSYLKNRQQLVEIDNLRYDISN